MLSMDEFNLDQAPRGINKEFQLEHVRLQTFEAATDSGCKKELISFEERPLKCSTVSTLDGIQTATDVTKLVFQTATEVQLCKQT
ncbi:hypothetical protein TNCV_1904111 [Trichonephila clavipes]|nr:hypothetical protein TNCV_1904111 [Trichonephila clavipes]